MMTLWVGCRSLLPFLRSPTRVNVEDSPIMPIAEAPIYYLALNRTRPVWLLPVKKPTPIFCF